MKKSLSVLVGLSVMLTSLPALAEDGSSESSSSSSVPSSSSSSTAASSPSCAEKTGTELRECLKMQRGTVNSDRMNSTAHMRMSKCKDLTGLKKAMCMRGRMERMENKLDRASNHLDKWGNRMSRRIIRKAVTNRRGSASSSSTSSSVSE